MKLYKIWCVGKTDKWPESYPIEKIIEVTIFTRDQVVSINQDKLQTTLNYLNFCKCDDEHFEIREEEVECE